MDNKEVIEIIEKLSSSKKKHEEDKAIKNGFVSLYD